MDNHIEGSLALEEIKTLLKIKTKEDIKSLHIINEYTDDNLLCKDVIINSVQISFMWYDNMGFLTYYEDTPKAMNDLVSCIKHSVLLELEEIFDFDGRSGGRCDEITELHKIKTTLEEFTQQK